jgi:hypothetical protein
MADGFVVRLCCSRACESAGNVIRVFTNAAAVIQDLMPIVLRLAIQTPIKAVPGLFTF